MASSLMTRWWEKIVRRTHVLRPELGPCWEWDERSRDGNNYGIISVDGDMQRAHRVAWRLFRGADPGPMKVLHRCDNPPCVRPDHLFLGTIADNNQDMARKGRGSNQYKGKAACQRGHKWTASNTIWRAGKGRVFKECRECWLERKRQYRERTL